jgi:predicted O-methyltransferase YrrM
MKLESPMNRSEVLAGLAQSIDAKSYVDVGCKSGRTTGYLLSALPELQAVAIDPWCAIPNSVEDYKDWDFQQIEAEFWKNVGASKDRVDMKRTTSAFAAGGVPDNSVDIVFIDAAHDYAGCLQDINLWLPKVRKGGYLAGHDFNHKWPGVHRAVAKMFPLLMVTVLPDSVWCVNVDDALLVKVAA